MLYRIYRIIRFVLLFSLLTLVSQTGGIIYLCCKLGINIFAKKSDLKLLIRLPIYLGVYLLINCSLVPLTASKAGRVPLPFFKTDQNPLIPHNYFYPLLNRHYVSHELYRSLMDIEKCFKAKYPNSQLVYLDANFPFINGFPLLPHLSHYDGDKLDLSFQYQNKEGQVVKHGAGWLGYGQVVKVKQSEINQPNICKEKGYWQYSLLTKITWRDTDLVLDRKRTQFLIKCITKNKGIRKVFIEPHLKSRLGFSKDTKVRYHGCQAVRHDDHIHLQR